MLSFLAGMNQKDFAFYTVVHTPVVCNDRCFGYGVQQTAVSPQLQPIFKVVDFPVVPQRLIPMIKLFSRPSFFSFCRTHGGPCPCVQVVQISFVVQRHVSMVQSVRWTIDIPQLLCNGCRRPCCAGRAGSLPRRCAEAVPMVQTVRLTMDILCCSTRWPMSLLSWSCRFTSSSWRRGRFLMVRPVWQTIEISQLQYAPGGQCSCCAGRASLVKLAQDVLVGPCTQVHGHG